MFFAVLAIFSTCIAAEKVIKIPDMEIPFGERRAEKEVSFPRVPVIKGMIPVLRARIYNKFPRPAGWNNSNRFYINGKRLDRYTMDGAERLLYRGTLLKYAKNSRAWFLANGWLVYFCDGNTIDKRIKTAAKEKCWYHFDVSDVVYSSKNNKFKAVSVNRKKTFKNISLCIKDASIIYLPVSKVNSSRPKK